MTHASQSPATTVPGCGVRFGKDRTATRADGTTYVSNKGFTGPTYILAGTSYCEWCALPMMAAHHITVASSSRGDDDGYAVVGLRCGEVAIPVRKSPPANPNGPAALASYKLRLVSSKGSKLVERGCLGERPTGRWDTTGDWVSTPAPQARKATPQPRSAPRVATPVATDRKWDPELAARMWAMIHEIDQQHAAIRHALAHR